MFFAKAFTGTLVYTPTMMWVFSNLFQKFKILGPFWEKTFLGVLRTLSCCVAIFAPIFIKFWLLTGSSPASKSVDNPDSLSFKSKRVGDPGSSPKPGPQPAPDLQHPLSDQQLFTPAIHFTLNSGVPLWQIDLSKDEILLVNSEITKQDNSRFSPKIFFWVLQVCLPN